MLLRTLLVLCFVQICAASSPTNRSLTLTEIWDLPGDISGRIDHLGLWNGRLYVNALQSSKTVVFEDPNRLIRVIGKDGLLRQPQGISFDTVHDWIAITNAGDGTVRIFDAKENNYPEIRSIDLGIDADNVRFDGKHFLVGYGDTGASALTLPSAGIASIDPLAGKVVETFQLPAHAESFQFTSTSLYVNTPDAANGTIQVVDRKMKHVVDTWSIILRDGRAASENYPMALTLDPHTNETLVLIGCRRPAVLVLINGSDGTVLADVDAVSDVDDLWITGSDDDPFPRTVYATGGGGQIDTVKITRSTEGSYSLGRKASVPTSRMARTSLWDEPSKRLFVAAPKEEEEEDEVSRILIFEQAFFGF